METRRLPYLATLRGAFEAAAALALGRRELWGPLYRASLETLGALAAFLAALAAATAVALGAARAGASPAPLQGVAPAVSVVAGVVGAALLVVVAWRWAVASGVVLRAASEFWSTGELSTRRARASLGGAAVPLMLAQAPLLLAGAAGSFVATRAGAGAAVAANLGADLLDAALSAVCAVVATSIVAGDGPLGARLVGARRALAVGAPATATFVLAQVALCGLWTLLFGIPTAGAPADRRLLWASPAAALAIPPLNLLATLPYAWIYRAATVRPDDGGPR